MEGVDRRSWPVLCVAALATTVSLWIGLRATALVWTQQQPIVFPELEGMSIPRLILMAAYSLLGLIYCRWLLRPSLSCDRFAELLPLAAPFGLLALLAFPSSTDVFIYLQYGTMAWHGFNPYLVAVESFTSPVSLFLHWPGMSPYGPLSQLLFMAAAWIVDWGVLPALLLFKGLCLGLHGLNGYLIWRSVPVGPRRSKVVLAYLINPILLSEFVVNAHNEVLLVTAVILAITALYRSHYSRALLAMVAGAFVKTLPIVWLPIVGLYLVRRRQWRPIGIALGALLAVCGLLSQTLLTTPKTWLNFLDPASQMVTYRSLHHVVRLMTASWPTVAASIAMNTVTGLTLLVVGAIGLGICVRIWHQRDYDEICLVRDLTWITLALLLSRPFLGPWHTTTLLVMGLLTVQAPRLWSVVGVVGLSPLLFYGTGGGDNLIGLLSSLLFLAMTGVTLGLPTSYGKRWADHLQV